MLYDEFANKGGRWTNADQPSTKLTIEWPAKFSKDFNERAEVEDLVRQYLILAP